MHDILPILMGAAMAATVVVLFAGVITFAFNERLNAKYGNKLMRWRVILQGVALVIFGLMMALQTM
ncbi:MAG: HIG1 domain-containing protein [Bacteroidales bacterium]|nr:HIG1 domain-containing protein [Bacteroidales bacterium]